MNSKQRRKEQREKNKLFLVRICYPESQEWVQQSDNQLVRKAFIINDWAKKNCNDPPVRIKNQERYNHETDSFDQVLKLYFRLREDATMTILRWT